MAVASRARSVSAPARGRILLASHAASPACHGAPPADDPLPYRPLAEPTTSSRPRPPQRPAASRGGTVAGARVTFTGRHPRAVATSLAELRAWPENPRRISPGQLDALQRALTADPEMLWARPLIALPDGLVVCGNQRLRAALELGWTTIPTIRVDLDTERARLWALRDNNTFGEWDEGALASLLEELSADGVDLALTGFDSSELDRLLADLQPAADPDEAPPLPAAPDSQPGCIYELGPHRLACGDARDPDLLAALAAGAQVEVVWSDPPYGVGYVGKTKNALTIDNDTTDGLPGLLSGAFAA